MITRRTHIVISNKTWRDKSQASKIIVVLFCFDVVQAQN